VKKLLRIRTRMTSSGAWAKSRGRGKDGWNEEKWEGMNVWREGIRW